MLRLRVFVSSPGDVGAERAVALAVVERLQFEFRGRIELEAYLWERSLLRATDSFQAQILDIREADLALFILWASMGTPLPVAQFSRDDGSQYRSGTEYEFERARESHDRKRTPEMLCYLKTAEVRLSLKDRAAREAQVAELDAIGRFVDKWFRNADGTFQRAFYNFEKTAQFEELIEVHLRDWIKERIKSAEVADTPQPQWKGSPFRGLQAFDFEHALIYCGRTGMVAELLEALRRRGAAGQGFLLVTGMSGVGKSSLVKAGLLPILLRPGVVPHVIGWRRAVFKPNDGEHSLLMSFAAALIESHALPELAAHAGAVAALLHDLPALTMALTRAIEGATRQARAASPLSDPEGTVRLVVVCDQFEEIFDETVTDEERTHFCELLRAMILTGHVWIVATLRADFFSRCSELPERFRDLFVERGGLFTAGGPRPAEIAQMIRRPAMMAGLTFERRGDPEEGLDDVLRDAACGHATVLPLLEFTLDELWRRSKGSGLLTFADYENLGGLQGAIKIRADETFARAPEQVRATLPQVLAALVHTDPSDERLILQNRTSLTPFKHSPQCLALINAFVSAHLFVGDNGPDGTPMIGLAHEALLREWPPAVQWIEHNRETLRLRAGISAAAALWRNSDEDEGRLMAGALLRDANKLNNAQPEMLSGEERRFVNLSLAADRGRRRRLIRNGTIAAALVGLAVLVPTIGYNRLAYGISFARTLPLVWNAQPQVPISASASINLRTSIKELGSYLHIQVAGMGYRPELNPWAIAEIWLALDGLDPALESTGDKMRDFMRANRDEECRCWRELGDDGRPHALVTAWVLYALAQYKQPADADTIEGVLQRQGAAGWWAMFPSTPEEVNASTTATAWTALALHHQLERNLVAPAQRARVTQAIAKATDWLTARAIPGTARWNEYPPEQTFEKIGEYLAASALVIHVLRTITATTRFDATWLDTLPQRVPDPRENEMSKALVHRSKTQITFDDARHYRFPWMLRTTVEAYANGNVAERGRGLLWIEQAFKAPLHPEDLNDEYWTIAETLFALRQVQTLFDTPPPKPAVSMSEPLH